MWHPLALALVSCALAASHTESPPAEIASVIHADKPFGAGSYGALFITAYDAQLWTDAPHWGMEAPFALTLRYRMGFSTDEIVSRSRSEMKHVEPVLDDGALRTYSQEMAAVFPPVRAGDELTALYEPGKPVRFFHNGTATGEIEDAGFAEDFFGIWLSPRTSAGGLRKKLLRLK